MIQSGITPLPSVTTFEAKGAGHLTFRQRYNHYDVAEICLGPCKVFGKQGRDALRKHTSEHARGTDGT